ncbi:hypothetical protein [Brachybacterium sp. ACRRE]|uniref:hypothetical protein n=1 Tax=Brachybacterium sp. ACRRE TaxID=2918184 RepID=UPI001EF24098|nr:hypothetical protein [Brachybacterium sp. ACRRE]MCG7308300.1 hypothetical protein [Brachybacterium sp. ACRRE]
MDRTNKVPAWILKLLLPLAVILGASAFALSPANGASLTSAGDAISPQNVVAQAVGIQPAALDRGGAEDNMPPCARVDGETDPIKCLPITRWTMSMAMTDSVEFNVTQPLRSVEVNILEKPSFEGIMTVGNFAWLIAALLVDAATNWKVNAQLVKPLNDFAASFGTTIIDSGAIFLVIGAGALALGWATFAGGFNLRRLLTMLAALGAFCALIWGSLNDTGEGGTYEPGTASPAWLVQETSAAFSKASDAIATPISDRSSKESTVFSDAAKKDPTSCKAYIDELHREYTSYYEDRGETAPAALNVMSRWWEETGYRVFSDVQYGDESTLGADYAACHQLDGHLQMDAKDRHDILQSAYTSGDESYAVAVPAAGSPMLNDMTNDKRVARQSQAWGLCAIDAKGNYSLRADLPKEGIEGGKIGGPITPEACKQIFTGSGNQNESKFVFHLPFSDKVSADTTIKELSEVQFAVVGDKDTLQDPDNGLASHPQAYAYVSNVSGTTRTAHSILAWAYAVSAVIGGLAMALLAAAVFVMKLLSYVMAFFLIIAALAGVVSQGFGSSVAFFKSWIGYTAITSVTTLLFAFVQMVAMALIRMGDGFLGQWAVAMLLWIGLAPALSIFLLNLMWRKLFQAKSPFTLRGMQAMAGNPLAVGGAALAGGTLAKGAMDAGRRRITDAAWGAAKGKIGVGKGKSTDGSSVAQNDDLVADAENPVETSGKSDAVTSGSSVSEAAVTDGASTEKVSGAEADAEDSLSIQAPGDDTDDLLGDASMIGDPLHAVKGKGADSLSFADKLAAFQESGGRDDTIEAGAEKVGAAAVSTGATAQGLGRGSRLALGRAASIPANIRRQIAGGAQTLREKWQSGQDTRSAIWNNKALTAQYLTTRGMGASMKVVGTAGSKLAAAAKDPATYKRALKGAALYGGLGLATGGLAVPAAVMGGRALLKHRQSLAHGAGRAAGVSVGALTGVAKNAYRAGVPEMSTTDRQEALQTMELEARIKADQSDDAQAPITELAHGLPVVQERQLTLELQDALASYDAFQAENGRVPDADERTSMVEDLPFYSSMNSDPQLKAMFDQKVAEESAKAQEIFSAHQREHGDGMAREQMREATRELPFYSQSVLGLDPRQGALHLEGMGSASAPAAVGAAPVTAVDARSFDPAPAQSVTISQDQGSFALPRDGRHRANDPSRITR